MPFFVKVSDHDLCSVHCICQLGVAHAIGRMQQCCWRWERVTCRCSSLAFEDGFKKAFCVSLRDGTAKIIPELMVTVCISNSILNKKNGTVTILHTTLNNNEQNQTKLNKAEQYKTKPSILKHVAWFCNYCYKTNNPNNTLQNELVLYIL